MTLAELEEIKAVITRYLESESCAETMDERDTLQALDIIEREIKLKTMDPRKDKENDGHQQ